MLLKSTIFKADLQITCMDRHYYDAYTLKLVHHPFENDKNVMMCVLAFSLHADLALSFSNGLSANEELDL